MGNIGDDDPFDSGGRRFPNIGSTGRGVFHTVPTVHGQRGILSVEEHYAEAVKTPVRLVAQIFGKPGSHVMDEIYAHDAYMHLKTAERMNFYFPGYEDGVAPSAETFRLESYIKAQVEMEQLTTWKGGLETYLLLMNSVYDADAKQSRLDYSGVVTMTFERALHDKAIPSVAALLTEIMQFADSYEGDDPTWGFSEREGRKLVGSALVKLLIHFLPKWLKGNLEKAKYFAVRDVSR